MSERRTIKGDKITAMVFEGDVMTIEVADTAAGTGPVRVQLTFDAWKDLLTYLRVRHLIDGSVGTLVSPPTIN
jgi:hypothetical protein